MKVKKGKYQHFKGNFYKQSLKTKFFKLKLSNFVYEVLGVAKNSENLEEEWVVYRPLYKSKVVTDLCIRPKAMFLEKVERDGKKVSRFKFIGND